MDNVNIGGLCFGLVPNHIPFSDHVSSMNLRSTDADIIVTGKEIEGGPVVKILKSSGRTRALINPGTITGVVPVTSKADKNVASFVLLDISEGEAGNAESKKITCYSYIHPANPNGSNTDEFRFEKHDFSISSAS